MKTSRLWNLFTTEFISSAKTIFCRKSNHKNVDTWDDHASQLSLSGSRSSSSGFSNSAACRTKEWDKRMATIFRCRRCSGRWSLLCYSHPLGQSSQNMQQCHRKVFQVVQCYHEEEIGRIGPPGLPMADQVFQCQLDQLFPGQARMVLIQMWLRRCAV